MISSYKLSKAHSSSLPLLEFIRDVGGAFTERPEVPLRIVSILAESNTEIATDTLQEIVKMLDRHNYLIERCSILIEGKIQALTNDDGSMKVLCSPGDDGEPQPLWISSDVDAADADANVTPGKRRRGLQQKKSGPPPKKGSTDPSQDVEGAVRLKRKRRVRHRKNPHTAPLHPPKEPEGADAVTTDVNPPQPSDSSREQPIDTRDETIVRRRGRRPPRQHPPTGEVDEKPTPARRGRRRPRNKKPLDDSEAQPITEKRARAPRPFFRGRGRERINKSASVAAAEVAPYSAPL